MSARSPFLLSLISCLRLGAQSAVAPFALATSANPEGLDLGNNARLAGSRTA